MSATDSKTSGTARRSKRKIAEAEATASSASAPSEPDTQSATPAAAAATVASAAVKPERKSPAKKVKSKSNSPAKKQKAAEKSDDAGGGGGGGGGGGWTQSKASLEAKANPYFPENSAALHAWYQKNHSNVSEQYFGTYNKSRWPHAKTQPERLVPLLNIALCYGWIDSRTVTYDETRYIMRFTPRRHTENWSAVNRAKVLKLIEDGEMTEAGRAVFSEDMLTDPKFNLKNGTAGAGSDGAGGSGGGSDEPLPKQTKNTRKKSSPVAAAKSKSKPTKGNKKRAKKPEAESDDDDDSGAEE